MASRQGAVQIFNALDRHELLKPGLEAVQSHELRSGPAEVGEGATDDPTRKRHANPQGLDAAPLATIDLLPAQEPQEAPQEAAEGHGRAVWQGLDQGDEKAHRALFQQAASPYA